jgi:hypothetical protein
MPPGDAHLMPSAVKRALDAFDHVVLAGDLKDYLQQVHIDALWSARTLLKETLSRTAQVCDDPVYDRALLEDGRAMLRWREALYRKNWGRAATGGRRASGGGPAGRPRSRGGRGRGG